MTTAIATSAGPPNMSNGQPNLGEKVMSNGHQSHLTEKDHGISGLPPTSEKQYPRPITTTEKPQTSPTGPLVPSPYSQPHAGPSKAPSPLHPPHLLSSHLLAHPDHTVKRAMSTQFPLPNPLIRLVKRFNVKHSVIKGMTDAEWKKFEKMGPELRRKAGWKASGTTEEGVEIGDLFWKMYMSLLPTLERDPLSGLVPPDLLGGTTTMPLTIISLIPDIMQHYHDVIVRAREEVFLATNYWQPSNSVTTITGSLIELSKLIIKEGRKKVVVKIMYDRGSLEQIYNSHAMVPEDKWKPLDLPGPDDIPGLELEVINFHRVLLGTFHAKFLIVDRKVALINSNNIQDRPNLELMSHLEGPIVDSFYEIALHSWYNRLSPMLPCMSKPYQPPSSGYLFSDSNPFLDDIEVLKAAKAARLLLRQQTKDQDAETARLREEEGIPASDRLRDAVKRVVDHQRQNLADWRPGERFDESVQRGMLELREMKERWTGVSPGGRSRPGSRGPSRRGSANEGMFRSLLKGDKVENSHPAPDPSEAPSSPTIAETPVKSKTYPQPGHMDDHDEGLISQKHVAFAPVATADPILAKPIPTKLTVPEPRFGDTISSSPDTSLRVPTPVPPPTSPASTTMHQPTKTAAGEAIPPSAMTQAELHQAGLDQHAGLTVEDRVPVDEEDRATIDDRAEGDLGATESVVPEGMGSKRLYKMSKMFNAAGVLSEAWATVEDSDELDTFQPHVIHKPHNPVPVAMCCRKPHGFPGHHDIRNPQNAAWLAGFRYAKKKVFVQTPTLNARPIVRAIKQACRRDVQVELLLDLGFNDKGESIPFQGGTNEEVVLRLYKALRKEKKEGNLKVYWYTGKDQVRPLNAVKKQRNCHIKFAAYDDEVLIIGNGNQDSQSWFHSQEVNIMVDSKQIVKEMMDTLLTNQNTIQYGLVDTDGVWRDKEGKTLQDYGATEGGRFKGLSGFIAFAKTI